MSPAAEFVPPAIGELRHWAQRQGWRCKEQPWKRDYQMKLWRRAGENVCLIWRGGEFSAEDSWFESPEIDHRGILNPALASNVLRTHIPTYDFAPLQDFEVLEWLRGKKITWLSAMTTETQSATVPDLKSTSISCSQMGRRFLTFAFQSFQSVALDAITDVT